MNVAYFAGTLDLDRVLDPYVGNISVELHDGGVAALTGIVGDAYTPIIRERVATVSFHLQL